MEIFLKKIGISASREFKFSTTPRASSRCFEGEPRPLTRVFRAPGAWLGFPPEGPPRDQSSVTTFARCNTNCALSLRGALDLNEPIKRKMCNSSTNPPSPWTAASGNGVLLDAYRVAFSGRGFGADLAVNSAVSRAQRPSPREERRHEGPAGNYGQRSSSQTPIS